MVKMKKIRIKIGVLCCVCRVAAGRRGNYFPLFVDINDQDEEDQDQDLRAVLRVQSCSGEERQLLPMAIVC